MLSMLGPTCSPEHCEAFVKNDRMLVVHTNLRDITCYGADCRVLYGWNSALMWDLLQPTALAAGARLKESGRARRYQHCAGFPHTLVHV